MPIWTARLDAAVFMIYSLNGERCTSSSRLLVEDTIYDEFTALVAEKAKRIKVGHPLDPDDRDRPADPPGCTTKRCSPISTIGQCRGRDRRRRRRQGRWPGGGCYVAPTLFTGASNDDARLRRRRSSARC